jgi:hypothetical protein
MNAGMQCDNVSNQRKLVVRAGKPLAQRGTWTEGCNIRAVFRSLMTNMVTGHR